MEEAKEKGNKKQIKSAGRARSKELEHLWLTTLLVDISVLCIFELFLFLSPYPCKYKSDNPVNSHVNNLTKDTSPLIG